MSIGMMLISVELLIMLCILLFVPGDYAGQCFIGFAIGESLGAAALRIAGGIFTKIADIGSDLMKIVFKIKEDDARNPGVIADCTGDNAGDSVGPSADGFETYGVTGVALITFILLGVKDPHVQVQLLVWIFVMRIMMLVSSTVAYFLNEAVAKARYGNADEMNFEAPLTSLVWLTSIVSIVLTYIVSKVIIPDLGGDATQWWKLATIISCGTLAGAVIPELVKVFTSVSSGHVKEVVTSAEEGGASLDILSGLVAGNFSCYYLGFTMVVLMSIGYFVSTYGLGMLDAGSRRVRLRPGGLRIPRHGPGDDRGRFLRTGDRQRAVGVRAVADRAGPEHRERTEEGLQRRRQLRSRQAHAGRKRRRGQHLQGYGQTGADRNRRRGRDHHDFLHHHGAHPRAHRKCRQTLAAARSVCARTHQRWRHHLLVHRRLHAGRHHRRLSRGGVHQEEHPAGRRRKGLGRGQQEGRRNLHQVRAEGHVQHLPRGVLRDPGVRLRGAVLLYRLPDLDCHLRLCTRRCSWPTPAVPGTTPRRSSRSN